MAKKAIIVFAEGFEEIEAITPADVLRRSEVHVDLVGLDAMEVTGGHGITLRMDRVLKAAESVDAIILPGGQRGAENLAASARLADTLLAQLKSGGLVAAICAAPALVLAKHGILDGRKATCYPGFESHFKPSTKYVKEDVVIDENVMTSRGPGTAFPFALALARELAGPDVADKLAKGMLHVR